MAKSNQVALGLIFCLFFLWAVSSNLLPTMIRQLMKTCELNTFEASFTESAYWLAYFVCPIPIAMFLRHFSYRAGIVVGLLLAAIGGLLFFPATMVKSYAVYLCVFFVIATGMCFLETAANPYVQNWGILLQLHADSIWRNLLMDWGLSSLPCFLVSWCLVGRAIRGNLCLWIILAVGMAISRWNPMR